VLGLFLSEDFFEQFPKIVLLNKKNYFYISEEKNKTPNSSKKKNRSATILTNLDINNPKK